MEIIFEFIFQVLAEVVLQIVAEGLFEFGLYSLAEALERKRRRNSFLAAIGYLLWGGIIGGVTLLIFPSLMIEKNSYRILNLFFAPIVAGIAMSAMGSWRRKKGHDLLRIDSFTYGALFAFGMALVRLLWNVYFR